MGNVLAEIFKGLTKAGVNLPPDPNADTVAIPGTGGSGMRPGMQTKYFDSPEDAAIAGSHALPSGDAMLGPDVLNPSPTSLVPMPSQIQQPSFQQANQTDGLPGMGGARNPALTTKGKVLSTILQAAFGGLEGYAAGQQGNPRDGYPNANAGSGFAVGEQLPFIKAIRQQGVKKAQLENQFQQMSLSQMSMPVKLSDGSSIPLWQAMQQQKYDEVQSTIAQKQAETKAIPTETKLKEAQTLAARYKEDPSSGALIDLQTQQPVNGGQMIPVQTPELATVLNVPVGTKVPLVRAQKAATLLTTGATTLNTEEGVFDYNRVTGQKTRLGNNPREITLDTPVGALDNTSGKQVMVTKKDIIANPGRFAPVSADVSTPVIKQTLKDYASTRPNTAGGNIIAFNTAILHLGLLADAADALGNGQTKLFNSISQKWKEQTGSPLPLEFDTIKQMASGEITKVGGSLNQGEQEAVKGPLDRSNSPQALKGSITKSVQLMDGKISVLHQHYLDVMHEEPESPLIYPEVQKVRDRLLGSAGAGNAASHPLDRFWKN